jgi:hypothetical protein
MPEDRDRLFEKALERHLRAAVSRELVCPDAEQLAAYHQSTLAQDEMTRTRSHLASCARCREILALLESSGETSGVGEEPAMVAVFEEATGLVEPMAPSPAAPPKVTPILRSRPRWLRSAVPAGAIAAGLVLWIGITVFRTRPKFTAAPTEVADNRREAPARRDSNDALKSVEALPEYKEETSRADSNTRQDSTLADKTQALADAQREYSRRAAVPPRPALGVIAPRAPSQKMAQTPPPAAESQGAPERQAGSSPIGIRSEAPAAGAAPAPSPSAASAAAEAAPPPAPPSSESRAASAKVQNQAAAALLQKKDGNAQEFSVSAGYNAVASSTVPVRILAPGGKRIWSIGGYGRILFSEDGGRTWIRQFSPIQAALTAGSAPSDRVCWLAGAAGTLLRTTDAGQHWQTVSTPINGDLGGVQAADAEHASIWDLPHNTRYETSDGGATWKPAANE